MVVFIASFLILSACSSSGDTKGKYDKSEENSRPLDVPPELTRPQGGEGLSVPILRSTGQQDARNPVVDTRLLPRSTDAKLVQEGDIRWLEIQSSPEKIWQDLNGFLRNLGFEIKLNDPTMGIIQTGWLDNEVYQPGNWFTRALNTISSSGLKDKYRIRIERVENNNAITRLYLTHQGMEEVAEDEITRGGEYADLHWQPRDSDPELEAEMMIRFLVFRGMPEDSAQKAVVNKPKVARAELVKVNGFEVIKVAENFDRTWRRTGLAIDRLGLMVDDRNRSEGLYYVTISEDFIKYRKDELGVVESLFGKSKDKTLEKFILMIKTEGDSTLLSVHSMDGKQTDSENAKLLTSQMYQLLR
jgi:outer membrane protein assembly factor BamC